MLQNLLCVAVKNEAQYFERNDDSGAPAPYGIFERVSRDLHLVECWIVTRWQLIAVCRGEAVILLELDEPRMALPEKTRRQFYAWAIVRA